MNITAMNPAKARILFALGLGLVAVGLYVAGADEAPGAAVIGILLMAVGVVLGVRAVRNRLPMWAAHTARAVGVGVAAIAALLTHRAVVTAPLFPQSKDVPSAVEFAPSAQHGVPSMSASPKRTSRSSRSSATSSSGRSVLRLRSHCLAIARRSTSRDPTTIPAVDDD